MATRLRICLIDEDPKVQLGWEQTLQPHIEVIVFKHPEEALHFFDKYERSQPMFECIVVARFFINNLDLLNSDFSEKLSRKALCPILLNWQGYVGVSKLGKKFDGKVFHRFGVKWQTLKVRLQKMDSYLRHQESKLFLMNKKIPKNFLIMNSSTAAPQKGTLRSFASSFQQAKQRKCSELLLLMATHSDQTMRASLVDCVEKDLEKGIQFLESLYNRLITYREHPPNSPSRYLNTSPVVAARMIREALN
jgi:hypothetical protein